LEPQSINRGIPTTVQVVKSLRFEGDVRLRNNAGSAAHALPAITLFRIGVSVEIIITKLGPTINTIIMPAGQQFILDPKALVAK
jgi:hypothetical protein